MRPSGDNWPSQKGYGLISHYDWPSQKAMVDLGLRTSKQLAAADGGDDGVAWRGHVSNRSSVLVCSAND